MSYFSDIYFTQLDNFAHKNIFQNSEQVWDPLKDLNKIIIRELEGNKTGGAIESISGLTVDTSDLVKGIIVNRWIKLENPIISSYLDIRIDSGTVLEPTAIIKVPAIIG